MFISVNIPPRILEKYNGICLNSSLHDKLYSALSRNSCKTITIQINSSVFRVRMRSISSKFRLFTREYRKWPSLLFLLRQWFYQYVLVLPASISGVSFFFFFGTIASVFQKFLFPFNYWIVKIRLREEAFAFWRVLFIFYLALIFFQCDSPSHKPGYEYLFLYNHFRDLWSVIELNFLPYKWRYAR